MARRALSSQVRVQVLVRDGFKCTMCGRSASEVGLEVDHVVPVSAGGMDTLANLASLCRDCNRGKSDLILPDYRQLDSVPEEVERFFVLHQDAKKGDYVRWHLYCYYKPENRAGARVASFHREWSISGSRFAESSEPAALAQRRGEEEAAKFVQQIREELASTGGRLVVTEEGLVLLRHGEAAR